MQPRVATRLISSRKYSKQVSKQTGDMDPDVSSDVCSETSIGHWPLPPTPIRRRPQLVGRQKGPQRAGQAKGLRDRVTSRKLFITNPEGDKH